ncbi:molybdenum cofactor cytidylyltransferase [Robiginitalea myxolifaciens]|uniref:Molybdenum cofactor cytidylyltransferase n=1 Tax=Robiginitalea myxolifaciens TaxID=400055 RepID=A0A1I6GXY6_9FLAO|nr:nucleotidyltransferase family protein [Robiginitalea myxolifaciens]SFR47050.1 molybdenum cofactor cytidylyltransferase [Robiginitalea myxolifaciens]
MPDEIATLVLAAGASRRMGSPKALLPWGQRTVLEHLLEEIHAQANAEYAADSLIIVTGAHHDQIKSAIPSWSDMLEYNASWDQGMGNSLAFGIQRTQEKFPNAIAVMILLVDQPLIDRKYIRTLKEYSKEYPKKIIASRYAEGFGAPAIIPAILWDYMLLESPKQGAKSWMRKQAAILSPELHPDLRDIDTPAAYQRLHSEWKQNQPNTTG